MTLDSTIFFSSKGNTDYASEKLQTNKYTNTKTSKSHNDDNYGSLTP